MGGAPPRDGAAGIEFKLSADSDAVVHALATPGHTVGSTTFALGDQALFTGDALFIESVGRPDLAEQARQFAADLFSSIHDVILARPDDAIVFPAHFGPSVPVVAGVPVAATLGELRSTLPALEMDEETFIGWAASRATKRPPNYVEIVETNAAGARVDDQDRSSLELGPNRCAVDAPS